LTAAEAELLGRARRLADTDTADLAAYRQLPDADPVPAVLLLAHTPDTAAQTARAAAVLQLAAGRDLGAVWLGPWPPATLHVTADGTLHADEAARPAAVAGRVEILTAADAADLLTGLLPAVRDSLDVLDPTTLLQTAAPAAHEPAPVVDQPAADLNEAAEAAGAVSDTPAARAGAVDGAGRLAGAAVLQVGVLGRVRLTAAPDGREVAGLRAKVRDLLALLAVHPDGLGGEQVGEALWPDAPPGRAGGRLSATLALARRALRQAAGLDEPGAGPDANSVEGGPVDLLPRIDGRYRLHPDLLDTDQRRFTAALASARRAAQAGDTAGQLAALGEAAGLYRGEALDGIAYAWAEPVRETLRRQATDTLAGLADLLTDGTAGGAAGAGRQAALAALERAVEVDPYNEELYRRIMRLHAAAGRADAVRRTFRLLEARLADLDVDPDPDTVALAADLTRPRPRPRPTRTTAGRR
jgi:DNA-binding SARP family transcriptional activator